jgi:hypothetical protein
LDVPSGLDELDYIGKHTPGNWQIKNSIQHKYTRTLIFCEEWQRKPLDHAQFIHNIIHNFETLEIDSLDFGCSCFSGISHKQNSAPDFRHSCSSHSWRWYVSSRWCLACCQQPGECSLPELCRA